MSAYYDMDDDMDDDPPPTCTITEAKRRHSCLTTALFHLRLGREALTGVQGTDLTDLDSLLDDVQEALAYYKPAADAD